MLGKSVDVVRNTAKLTLPDSAIKILLQDHGWDENEVIQKCADDTISLDQPASINSRFSSVDDIQTRGSTTAGG